MTKLRIAAVGDNCIDKFLPPVGQALIGGNAVNVGQRFQPAFPKKEAG